METKTIKILAIDDNPDNLIVLKALLAEKFPDVKYLEALSGEKGIELCLAENPDVILLDIVMPVMDGHEVCRKIKANDAVNFIPVVMITASRGDTESRIKALESGADAFLTKPIDESELTAQIRAMIQIKKATEQKKFEKERLEVLVEEKTRELTEELKRRKEAEKELKHSFGELEKKRQAELLISEKLQAEIDERKRTETALRESEARFRLLIEHSHDAIALISADGTLIYDSPSIERVLGYSPNERIGRKIFEFLHPEERENMAQGFSEFAMQTGTVSYCEVPFIHKDGSIHHIECTHTNLLNEPAVRAIVANFHDITQRKQAEFELREKEYQYHNLADSGLALIWTTGTDGLCKYFNEPWLKFTGRTLEQEMGNGWLEGVHPLDREACVTACKYCLDNQSKLDLELRLRHVSGEYSWFRNIGNPNYNSAGEFIGYIGYCFDITEQKRANKALLESRQMLEAVINTIPARVFWKDKNLNFLGCNTRFAHDSGFGKPEDIIGKDDYAMGWRDNAELYRADDLLVIASGNPKLDYEEMQTTPSGEQMCVLASKVPLRNISGEIFALLGTYTDISKRKKAEEALTNSEIRYRRLFETSKDGIIILDSETGKIVDVNPYLTDLMGYSKEEITEKAIWEIGFFKDIVASKDKFTELLKKKYVRYEDLEIERADGQKIDVEFVSNVYSVNRHPVIQCNIRDITERKQAQEALIESEKNYRELIDGMNETVWVIDFNGDLIDVNKTAVEVLGYSKEELLNTGLYGIDSSLKKEDIKALAKAMPSDKLQIFETTHKTKNGKTFPVEVYSSLLTYGGNKAILSIARDITDRKEAEEALIELSKFNRQIINDVQEGIIVLGLDLKYEVWNQYMENLTGTPASKVLGKHVLDLFPFLQEAGVFDNINKALNGEISAEVEFPFIIEATGKNGWSSFMTGPLRNAKDKVTGVIITVRDITGRKLTEKELNNQREILQRILDNIPIMISYFDESGSLIFINNELVNKLGWTFEEWKTENILAKCYPDPKAYKELLEFMISKPGGWKDFTTRTKYGNNVWTSWTNISLPDGYSVGIGQDINLRKQAEDALRESEEKFRRIFEDHAAVKLLIDPVSGEIIDANKSAAVYYGWSRKELKKMKISQINTLAPEEVQKQMDIAVQQKRVQFEFRHRRKDGSIRDVEVFSSKIEIGNNDLLHSIVFDITERKLADQQIKIFENAVENGPSSLVITDANGKILFVNNKFTAMTLYHLEEVRGKTPRIFNPGNLGEEQFSDLWKTLKKGSTWSGEILERRKDKSLFWEEVTISALIKSDGMISNYILIMNDISDKKQMLEDLIAAKEHAEESDRLKSAFLANMSHEIRTPMNGILGFASLLKEQNLTGKEQKEYISIIEKSGARMLNIINDIMSISKVEAGQIDLIISETNVNELIKYIYSFFKPEAQGKGLKLLYKTPLAENEATVKTDKEKLTAILTNLVKNALKFTWDGAIELGYEVKGKSLEFFVSDTGIGISPEYKGIIFERFRQGSESLTRNYEGAGLGLPISKAYVEMLGGKIRVESLHGEGSVFYFTIPYKVGEEETAVKKQVVPVEIKESRVKNLKILIVEDDIISEKLLTIAVKLFSKEILTVKNGKDAIEICRNQPDIDLVLMDVQMPQMDGYEATRQIRQFNRNVVIIAQTAYAMANDRIKAIEAGCDNYIPKPVDKALLTALINKHFKDKVI